MKTLVAINSNYNLDFEEVDDILFGTNTIKFGIIDLQRPIFDGNNNKNDEYLLIKVKALSCNYRDKSVLLDNYLSEKNKNRLFFPFGSEFCAEVIEVGKKVTEFNIGDYVMPNSSYPNSGKKGIFPGVATNFATLGWIKIHKNKIIKVPDSLTLVEAACFTLGSQTAASMIRRTKVLESRSKVAVLSAKSATSLFIIKQLLAHGIIPTCISSSNWSSKEKNLVYPCEIKNFSSINMNEKFTHIFDPFFD